MELADTLAIQVFLDIAGFQAIVDQEFQGIRVIRVLVHQVIQDILVLVLQGIAGTLVLQATAVILVLLDILVIVVFQDIQEFQVIQAFQVIRDILEQLEQ